MHYPIYLSASEETNWEALKYPTMGGKLSKLHTSHAIQYILPI